ncbi:dnaJ homolog subfamily C member 8 [Strongylocentrotus purpuratus]|uniref:J domain-containing protein n=1 Tax=Strongylocentrotus purpuratus TaxID=7668 RepID=A0A7M7T3J5_STRPU|nr:dnaJ homolog subfamily C member 8 [Strongylocentrotus purpuratus]|eukprot:XP_003723552.1 PREDICTED: dnaJ homolog subfamily C member 8 isoform X2 [Strongylocentrotus purpuratus]
MASSSSATGSGQPEVAFSSFMTEVKLIEKRDSSLTPKQQIERLIRPGCTYFNLNPYEVLQVDPSMEVPDIKKLYRRLSILVHPDKNMDDRERAQKAFDALSNAMKTLEDETSRKSILDTIEEAKQKTDFLLGEKRKQLKKDDKPTAIEEDDPLKYKETLHKNTVKLFADYAIRRKEIEEKEARIKKREREEEIKEEDKSKKAKEWQKDWEDGRDKRVHNWRDFSNHDTAKKKKKNRMAFKPPKPKLETR